MACFGNKGDKPLRERVRDLEQQILKEQRANQEIISKLEKAGIESERQLIELRGKIATSRVIAVLKVLNLIDILLPPKSLQKSANQYLLLRRNRSKKLNFPSFQARMLRHLPFECSKVSVKKNYQSGCIHQESFPMIVLLKMLFKNYLNQR